MENCEHKYIDTGYGFRYSLKLRGLGVYSICLDCNKTFTWIDDEECNTPEEIEHNKKICKEKNIKYEWYKG